MGIAQAIAKNTLYQAVGKVFGLGFGVVSFVFMSRYLGPSDFGAYSTAITFVSIFATLADLGLPVLHLRILALRKTSDRRKLANLNSLRIVSTIVILLIGIIVARFFPYGSAIQNGILISTVGYAAVSFTQYILVVFQERLATGRAAIAEVVGRGLMFGLVALAVYQDLGLYLVFWASTLGSISAFILSLFFSRTIWKARLASDVRTWPSLLKVASPLMFITLFSIVYFKIDTLLLSLLRDATAVGIYSAAYKYMDVFITFPALFTQLLLPFFTRAATPELLERLQYLFKQTLRVILIGGIPFAVLTFFEADRLVTLFSGDAYDESAVVLRILAFAVVPLFLGNLCTVILIGLGRAKLVAYFFGIAAVIGIVGYTLAIQAYGVYGAAIMTVIAETFIALASFIAVSRHSRALPQLRAILTILFAGTAMGVALYFAAPLPLIVSMLLAVLVYGVALLLTRAIRMSEISQLLGKRLLLKRF
jgi:O-antigen/teichoic acid export membrane protein